MRQDAAYRLDECKIDTSGPCPVIRSPAGITYIIVHYSADQDKDEEWLRAQKARSDAVDASNWDQEMEISFETVSGALACDRFSHAIHAVSGLRYSPSLPLVLSCDFNVDPMAWVVGQPYNDDFFWISEIWLSPGSIDDALNEFMNRYGDHAGELWLVGDPTGRARTQQNIMDHYTGILTILQRMPARVRMKVRRVSASHVSLRAAFNRTLMRYEGTPHMFIDRDECPELVADCLSVTMEDRVTIKKERNPKSPYYFRGHALDAAMYAVERLYPIGLEIAADLEKDDDARYRAKVAEFNRKGIRKTLLGVFND